MTTPHENHHEDTPGLSRVHQGDAAGDLGRDHEPGWAEKYGYACRQTYDLRPGGAFKAFASTPMKAHGVPDEIIVGEIIESTHRPGWSRRGTRSGIRPAPTNSPRCSPTKSSRSRAGFTKLTVIHDVTGAPIIAKMVAGEAGEAGRRLGVDPQRPQDAARDGNGDGRRTVALTSTAGIRNQESGAMNS